MCHGSFQIKWATSAQMIPKASNTTYSPFMTGGVESALEPTHRVRKSLSFFEEGMEAKRSGPARRRSKKMSPVEHLNPEGLPGNPAFSQAVSVTGPHRTIYVGGQDAVDAAGNILGRGDIVAQTRQIFANLKLALAAGGAGLEHIVKWNIYIVHGQDIQRGFAVFQEVWDSQAPRPAISGSSCPRLPTRTSSSKSMPSR